MTRQLWSEVSEHAVEAGSDVGMIAIGLKKRHDRWVGKHEIRGVGVGTQGGEAEAIETEESGLVEADEPEVAEESQSRATLKVGIMHAAER